MTKPKEGKIKDWETKKIIEVCDDTYKLSDDDWVKKYGDKGYQQVIATTLKQQKHSLLKEIEKWAEERIDIHPYDDYFAADLKDFLLKLTETDKLKNKKK